MAWQLPGAWGSLPKQTFIKCQVLTLVIQSAYGFQGYLVYIHEGKVGIASEIGTPCAIEVVFFPRILIGEDEKCKLQPWQQSGFSSLPYLSVLSPTQT